MKKRAWTPAFAGVTLLAGILFAEGPAVTTATISMPETSSDIVEALEQGEALYARAHFQDAVNALRYAMTRSPQDPAIRASLALALEGAGQWNEALLLWSGLDAQEASQDPQHLYYLGRHYLMQGRYDLAEKTLVRFSVKNETAATASRLALARAATLLLAVSQYLAGRHAEALANLQFLQDELAASLPFATALEGASRLGLKQWNQALESLRAGLKKDSNLADFRRMLSETYAKTGDNDSAYLEGRRYMGAEKDKEFEKRFKQYAAHTSKPVETLLKSQEAGFALSWPRTVDFRFQGKRGRPLEVGLFSSSTGEVPSLTEMSVSASGSFKLRMADGSLVEHGKTEEMWRILFVTEPAPMAVVLRGSQELLKTADPFTLIPDDEAGGTFLIKGARAAGEALMLKSDLQLRGTLRLSPGILGVSLVNEVALEDYLLGVLPAEIGADSPPESFKAQAVLARSYALWRLSEAGTHKFLDKGGEDKPPLKLCDSVHCQVYKGYLMENAPARQAAQETAGQVLYENGKAFQIWYHASCGGILRDTLSWDAQGDTKRMILPGSYDGKALSRLFELAPFWDESPEWCFERNPRFGWIRLVSMVDLDRKAKVQFPKIGTLQRVEILERSEDGRVTSIRLAGSKNSAVISDEYPIRTALAPGALRSTLFSMIPIARKGRWEHILFIGRGYGHGHGMCQVGAIHQGKKGRNYKDILKSYYPKAEMVILP